MRELTEYVLLFYFKLHNPDLTELLDQHLEFDGIITMMTYTTRYNDRDALEAWELDGDRVVKRTMVPARRRASPDAHYQARPLDMLDWYRLLITQSFEALHVDYNRVVWHLPL